MPSFDVVNQVDHQEIDNTVNNTLKAIANRFDFRGSKVEIEFDRKTNKIKVNVEDAMKMEAVKEMMVSAAVKRSVEVKSLAFGDSEPGAGASVKCEITVQEGIDQPTAKKIVKMIKDDKKLKVQPSIQGDSVRVSGKKRDDLQAVIAMLKAAELDIPLQFVNMKD